LEDVRKVERGDKKRGREGERERERKMDKEIPEISKGRIYGEN